MKRVPSGFVMALILLGGCGVMFLLMGVVGDSLVPAVVLVVGFVAFGLWWEDNA